MRTLVMLMALGLGCRPKPLPEQEIPPGPSPDLDADADTDVGPPDDDPPDDDPDLDDTGSGDGDGDGDADGSIPCDTTPTQDPIDDCVTEELPCNGATPLRSSTKRGMDLYAEDLYAQYECFPFSDDEYSGPERIFAFTHPGGGDSVSKATLTLNAPCGELHLFAFQWRGWEDSDECPDEDNEASVGLQCEAGLSDDDGVITLDLYERNEMPYIIVVDGPDGEEENFTIEASCPE